MNADDEACNVALSWNLTYGTALSQLGAICLHYCFTSISSHWSECNVSKLDSYLSPTKYIHRTAAWTKISKVNLSAFIYRLFHKDLPSVIGTDTVNYFQPSTLSLGRGSGGLDVIISQCDKNGRSLLILYNTRPEQPSHYNNTRYSYF